MEVGVLDMVREIVRGKKVEVVQRKIEYMQGKGWYPVSEIKQDPTYYDAMFVCVMQNDTKVSNANNWGNKYHLE